MIDGWFMRKRIYQLHAFFYNGPNIREYCTKFLNPNDIIYRIFYYDTAPLMDKGHNPITKNFIDFSKTHVALGQNELLESIKFTANFALRLGKTVWQHKEWFLKNEKLKDLLSKKITVESLTEDDIKPLIKQKAVDMKMGLDIAMISIKKLADTLIIITGDADIVPALKLARREGMQVGLDPLWCPIQPELREHVDFIESKLPKPSSGPLTSMAK